MKYKADFHIHSTGSDGKLEPEEVVKEAIAQKLNGICFTDHYPLPKKIRTWGEGFHSEKYYKEVQRLQGKYSDKIEIYYGAEFDWVEGYEDYIKKEICKRKYDFILGSIHRLKSRGKYQIVNYSREAIKELVEEYGGIKNLIKEYYSQIRKLIASGLFDCVAHLDVIKYKTSGLFSEKVVWYRKEVEKTLELAAEKGICIEVNSSGLRMDIKDQYPSKWILNKMNKLDIPITIGSDGHMGVGKGIDLALRLAKNAGYNSYFIFKNRKIEKIKLE